MYCSKCGFKNNEDSKFCASFGSSLNNYNINQTEINQSMLGQNTMTKQEYYMKKKKSRNIVIIIFVVFFFIFFLIPLIVTPIILGSIDEKKQENANQYIKALENKIELEKETNQNYIMPTVIDQPDESLVEETPDEVLLYIDQNGKVVSGTLMFGKRIYKYENGIISYEHSEE